MEGEHVVDAGPEDEHDGAQHQERLPPHAEALQEQDVARCGKQGDVLLISYPVCLIVTTIASLTGDCCSLYSHWNTLVSTVINCSS